MAGTKHRARPSHYPPLAFHLIRTCSLISSLVVCAILSFFVYHLRHDQFKIPWTFLVLFGVSLLTLLSLTITLALHLCHVLSPLFNLFINVTLLVAWMTGISLLGWNMSGTLAHACSAANWGSAAGIMVCHIYKTLFSFALFASMSAAALVVLDFSVRKRQTNRGKYNRMRESGYDKKPTQEVFSSGALGTEHDDRPEPWLRPQHELNVFNAHEHSRENIRSEHFGYTAPQEQTHYDSGNYGYRDSQRPL